MSYNSAITLTKNDDTTDVVYDQISTINLSTTRAVSGRELDQPKEMKISHELNKAKTRTNSVIILDETNDVGTAEIPNIGSLRVQCKISYDNSVITAAQILDAVAELTSFLNVDANVTKLLNREH